jgi:hypothetical protein
MVTVIKLSKKTRVPYSTETMVTNSFFCLNKKGWDLGKNHFSEDAQLEWSNEDYKVQKYTPNIILSNMQFSSQYKALSVREISFNSIFSAKHT